MNETQKSLIYLLSCSVNGIIPDKARVQSMDLEKLYALAKSHSVQGAVCIALERAGVRNEKFYQAYKKAVRKNIFLDAERTAITAEFEKQGIWYMPLKGSVLKDLYPEIGMRQMADNDVLFDADRQYQVKEIMEAHGYTAESVGQYNHDVYMKPPVLNFELHTALFAELHTEPLYRYYSDVKRLLKKNEGSDYGYHFSDEDFYVYITAHEWKHYNGSGTGIRSLLDCYVYCKVKGDTLDWDYITEQCRQLETADYEQERRQLAIKVFSSENLPELDEEENDMLMYYLSSGTYGSLENRVKRELKTQGKLSFWLHRIFIPRNAMAVSVPFTAKSPLLYPAGVVWRCARVVFRKQDKIKRTVRAVRKYGK